MENKTLVGGVLLALVLSVIGIFTPVSKVVTQIVSGSAGGSTFNTAKTAAIVFAPVSNSASSTSVYNGDSSDRIIKDAHITCTGANFTAGQALSSVIFSAATTSATSNGLKSNPNLALYVAVSSSTPELYVASSSQGTIARRWNAGSYLTFLTNATSTGESCVVGVDYIAT